MYNFLKWLCGSATKGSEKGLQSCSKFPKMPTTTTRNNSFDVTTEFDIGDTVYAYVKGADGKSGARKITITSTEIIVFTSTHGTRVNVYYDSYNYPGGKIPGTMVASSLEELTAKLIKNGYRLKLEEETKDGE